MQPMSPVIKGRDAQEIVFAKDQPEYVPLPGVRTKDGMVTSRWQLTLGERLRLLFTGSLYLQVLTFNKPLQPVKLSVSQPEVE